MAFLAALGVLAGTFLSFPVACLFCFGSLPFSIAREFLADSTKISDDGIAQTDLFNVLGHYVLKGLSALLPDFARTSPADSLVDGMYISWLSLGMTAAIVVAAQTAILLIVACLIFRKRELASIQV